jgi:cell division protein FtsL
MARVNAQAVAPPAVGERLSVRHRVERVRRISLLPGLLVGGILLLGVLFYVWQHIQVVRLGYVIERLRTERAAALQRGRELALEIAQLKSLKRVEEVARTRLGMVTPTRGQLVMVPAAPDGERAATR